MQAPPLGHQARVVLPLPIPSHLPPSSLLSAVSPSDTPSSFLPHELCVCSSLPLECLFLASLHVGPSRLWCPLHLQSWFLSPGIVSLLPVYSNVVWNLFLGCSLVLTIGHTSP